MRFLIPLASLLILIPFDSVNACSCMRAGPPCDYYAEASAIFLGRVVGSAERKSHTDRDGNKTVYDVGTIRFLIQESFKGVAGHEVEIHSGKGGGDCGYWFVRNESYVVYAYESSEDKKLWTNICTRTAHVSEASEDLEYLRGLSTAKLGGTLYGEIRRLIGDPEHGPVKEGPKMAGLKILIKGADQSFEAVTNDKGQYRITGLPAGDYDAFPQLPENLGAIGARDTIDRFGSYSGRKPVKVSDRSCAEISFSVQFNGVVAGKITNAKGEPVKDVHINLVWAEDDEKDWSAWTDEEGRYEFHMVQPGNYFLGLNLRWAPGKEDPYPRTYYPGSKDKSNAALITVGEGEKLKGYDLTLPSPLAEREIRVTVVWPDGRPAVRASVNAELIGFGSSPSGNHETTDEKGRVAIKLFDDHRYIIYADARLTADKSVYAEPIEVLVSKNLQPPKLVLAKQGYPYDDVEKLKRKLSK